MDTAATSTAGGILLVDKPAGISSAAAVAIVKRGLFPGAGRRRRAPGAKVGHLGTLDPFASGLLPMCIGEGTKVAQYINTADKAYRGTIDLGYETNTLDVTGEVTERADEVPDAHGLDLDGLADRFTGTLEQIPPAFSAIKRDGVAMYKRARAGETPEIEPREVTIYRLELGAAASDKLSIEVESSKGTYVRSLARDIGRAIGCGATLASLSRTGFGPYGLDQAVRLAPDPDREGHYKLPEDALASLIPSAEALVGVPKIAVGSATAADLRQGRQRALGGLMGPGALGDVEGAETAGVVDGAGRLVAVLKRTGPAWKLDRVFS